jgi:hypothetical protein
MMGGYLVKIVYVYANCPGDLSGEGGYSGSDGSAGDGLGDNDGLPGPGAPITGFNPETLEEIKLDIIEDESGPKPKKEYKDKCSGLIDIWQSYPNNEVFGYITIDGQLIVTGIGSQNGAEGGGVYVFDGQAYYPSQEKPDNNYAGMTIIKNGDFYLIPIVSSVHTHSPCRDDGSSGVSQTVSSDDKNFAADYPEIRHWVIGCNSIAQFNGINNYYFNKSFGSIESNCSKVL